MVYRGRIIAPKSKQGMRNQSPIRVLYSFPHRLGASRICYTAWQQVNGLAEAGAQVHLWPASLGRAVPMGVKTQPTLAWGPIRMPYKLVGSMRAFAMHDQIVAHRLEKLAGQIDIIHSWPLGALRTLQTAARLGIPTVLERPNAHTRFAYEVVKKECERLGVALPADHEHAYKEEVLFIEEEEYDRAFRLLCPSTFVANTFLERGFEAESIARHQYGFDEKVFFPDSTRRREGDSLRMIFVGGCAPRKGLHYALEAWLQSSAYQNGEFLIAGSFVPGYAERLGPMLSHPSVKVLGHRDDVPELMRASDIFVLPTVEEGSALVTSEARGSGCVLLVSDAAGAICENGKNALLHKAGDVTTLSRQLTALQGDRSLLNKLRTASLLTRGEITWTAAGKRLLDVYRETIEMYRSGCRQTHQSTAPVLA
jgi:glycosyltransferase involved in cell wall biosynthesis